MAFHVLLEAYHVVRRRSCCKNLLKHVIWSHGGHVANERCATRWAVSALKMREAEAACSVATWKTQRLSDRCAELEGLITDAALVERRHLPVHVHRWHTFGLLMYRQWLALLMCDSQGELLVEP